MHGYGDTGLQCAHLSGTMHVPGYQGFIPSYPGFSLHLSAPSVYLFMQFIEFVPNVIPRLVDCYMQEQV